MADTYTAAPPIALPLPDTGAAILQLNAHLALLADEDSLTDARCVCRLV